MLASSQNASLNIHNNRVNGAFNTGSSRKDTLKKTTTSSSVDITRLSFSSQCGEKCHETATKCCLFFQFYPHLCNDRGCRSYKMHNNVIKMSVWVLEVSVVNKKVQQLSTVTSDKKSGRSWWCVLSATPQFSQECLLYRTQWADSLFGNMCLINGQLLVDNFT